MLDLRIPMGLMFSLVGAILAVYGLLTRGSEIYQRLLGINVNICWGGTLLLFGLAMLGLAWWASKGQGDKG